MIDQAITEAVQCNWKRTRLLVANDNFQRAVELWEQILHQLAALRIFAESVNEPWSEEVAESVSLLYKVALVHMDEVERDYAKVTCLN